jgi:ribonuclease HII
MTFFAGLDENGLGPLLGPLVVTGVLARAIDPRGQAQVQKRAPKRLRARLGDSKDLVSHDDNALGEAWARELGAGTGDAGNATVDQVLDRVLADPRSHYLSMCPSHHRDHCFGDHGGAHEAQTSERDVAMHGLRADVARDRQALLRMGIELVRVRSVVICNRMLNDSSARGVSRFVTDLHAMERLVLDFREQAGERVTATCGKVGGFDYYEDAFGPLAGYLKSTVIESRKVSTYEVAGVGRISFVMDADASNMLVSLASLVGKWVRDALMGKILGYYRKDAPDLPMASGYHDPVTRAFVASTALVRKERGIEDACFARSVAPKRTPKARAK